MKAAIEPPHEREHLQKRLKAHLLCAERNPRKRAQHISSARYCAEQLGVDLPRLRFSPASWVERNPRIFFVATETCSRRCARCAKLIPAGVQYFGMYEMSVALAMRRGGVSIRRTKRAKRLHESCAESIQ